jgi:AraC family transcriptional regulator
MTLFDHNIGTEPDTAHGSLADWYRKGPYAPYVLGSTRLTNAGTNLIEAVQNAGDLSDPPLSDLVIGVCSAIHGFERPKFTADYGAGRFGGSLIPQTFVCSPPDSATRIAVDATHHVLALSIPKAEGISLLERQNLPSSLDFGALHCAQIQDNFVVTIVRQLHAWSGAGQETHGLACDALLMALLLRLRELSSMPKAAKLDQRNMLTHWQVKRIRDYLMVNLAANIRLAELAATVSLSEYHFCRAFKQTVGSSPIHYLIQLRIERAMLLMRGGSSVADAALEVGYDDPAYFSRVFHKYTKCNPSAYVRAQLK